MQGGPEGPNQQPTPTHNNNTTTTHNNTQQHKQHTTTLNNTQHHNQQQHQQQHDNNTKMDRPKMDWPKSAITWRTMVSETRSFFSQLARARARYERPVMRRRAEQAWRMRWRAMFACAAARAVASSLLEMLHSHGGDGRTPAAQRSKATTVSLGWWDELSRDSVVHALSQF